jgi:cobalt-zinc-cadmium efflux system outer membrane protein
MKSSFRFSASLSFLFAVGSPFAAEPAVKLDDLVTEIVAHHPELAFYAAEIDAARAARRASTALADPELSASVGRKRVRDPAGALVGEGTAWSVSLSQTFEWPGRLALRKSLANGQVELAELGLARFRAALTARARTLAYGLHAAQEKAAAAAEVAARYRELREIFLARDPAGLTPLLETRVIEAQELSLQRRAADAALAAQSALVELNQLRGVPFAAPLRTTAGRLVFHAGPPVETALVAARDNNFDYRAAKLELEQQGLTVSLARHERRPSVTVSPFLSQETAGDRERTFGLGVTVPLPVGPRSGANVAAAAARRRQAEASVVVAQRKLEREVATAWLAFDTRVNEAAQWAPDSAEKFRDAAALADRHYRLGAVPLATYIELQKSYLDAIDALHDTQREALEAGLRLQELTGLDFNAVTVTPTP